MIAIYLDEWEVETLAAIVDEWIIEKVEDVDVEEETVERYRQLRDKL